MPIVITPSYFPFLKKMMHFQFSFNFRNMLNNTSILKLNTFSLIGAENFDPYPNFLRIVASLIVSLALTPTSKTVQFNENTVI